MVYMQAATSTAINTVIFLLIFCVPSGAYRMRTASINAVSNWADMSKKISNCDNFKRCCYGLCGTSVRRNGCRVVRYRWVPNYANINTMPKAMAAKAA